MLHKSEAIEHVLDGSTRCLSCQQGNCADREKLHSFSSRWNQKNEAYEGGNARSSESRELDYRGRSFGLIYDGLATPHDPPRCKMRESSILAIHKSARIAPCLSSWSIKHDNKPVERMWALGKRPEQICHGRPRCVHASFVLTKTEGRR